MDFNIFNHKYNIKIKRAEVHKVYIFELLVFAYINITNHVCVSVSKLWLKMNILR